MRVSNRLWFVLLALALAFVATACGSKESKVCNHLESIAEDSEEEESETDCEEAISELEEACPDMYDETLDCLLDADGEDDAAACALACAFSAMAEEE